MRASDYKEDLEYLYSMLLRHPSILEDEKRKAAFEDMYLKKKNVEYEYDSFIDASTELTAFFHDGHTNIEIPCTSQNRCLRLKCRWNEKNSNDLVLSEQYDDIPENARIVSVEGMTVEELILALSERIPHENLFLVKSRMLMCPYQNYHVFSEMNLKRLFGGKDYYTVSFLVGNKIVNKEIPLVPYDGFLEFAPDEEFLSYEILDNTVIMHLNACIFNERYKWTLKKLAVICNERKIKSFVLDLSNNMGGDSSVIDAFIKYTNVKAYRRYEVIDYSSGAARRVTNRNDVIENMREEVLFPEQIFCKVSHITFSSARTFAVTLKDNGIAKVYGNETGGKPNSYGMPKKMYMAKTNIRFRVSRCLFLRPDAALDDRITLVPEVRNI